MRGTAEDRALLAPWPLRRRPGWVDCVNALQTDAELQAVRRSIDRGSPPWQSRVVRQLGLESTLRPRGQPRKVEKGS